MDDTSTLISDLLEKLTELDNKVASYRKDMAAEFQRYSDRILRDIPEEVTSEVNRAIAAASMSGRFQSLYPDGTSTPTEYPESPHIDRKLWDGRGSSPPPVLHHTSGIPNISSTGSIASRALGSSPRDGPARDPHAREREFQGLFTPRYLPLLESSDREPHSPPTSPSPAPPVLPPLSSQPTQRAMEQPVATSGGLAPRLPPVRSFTDPSSDCGSGENGAVRRSALRRSSSSSNRTSPRRVRFDFEGEEVLPTSPPRYAGVVELPQLTTTEASPVLPSDSFRPTPSLLDDEEDYSPPPKKVSSSQALRALSKLPLEDPSTWTVVNPNSDPPAPLEQGTRPGTRTTISTTTNMTTQLPSPPDAEELENQSLGPSQLGSPLQDLEEYDDDASASDDDFVSMPIRPARKKSISPDSRSPLLPTAPNPPDALSKALSPSDSASETGPASDPSSHTETMGAPGKEVNGRSRKAADQSQPSSSAINNDDEGEDFFEMDDDSPGAQKKRESRPYLEHHEEESETEVEEPEASPADALGAEAHSHSTSTSRPVGQPGGSPPPSISVGSYKGRPISFDIVKNPMLHHKAAELGRFTTFVGSVDGRTGVDSADPTSSFRGGSLSGRLFVGTPRSLAERMILEEMDEEGSLPVRR